jgi:hypothetical protein
VDSLVQWYRRANHFWPKLLWWIVIGSLLMTLPIAADRFRTEHTSKRVEFVFDYRDLLEISDTKQNPRGYVEEQLKRMKQAGIQSMAVYESTLNELRLARRIELYNSREATALTQTPAAAEENYAYILFTDKASQPVVQEMVETSFRRQGVKLRPWTYKNTPGLILELPLEDAVMKPMTPDPIALKALKDKGFDILARLGNRNPVFSAEQLEATLKLLQQYGVQSILVDGESVPGYSPDSEKTKVQLAATASLFNKYHMALAAIELQKAPQKGFTTLIKAMDYNVIRLHSFTERDADKLAENITTTEQEARIREVADRLVLAVKDRNIRLVFLNGRANKNLERGVYTDPLEPLYESLSGPDGAVKQIQDAGFTLGKAHAFERQESSLQKLGRPFAFLGAIALVALTLSYFVPWLSLLITLLGVAGGGALFVLSPVITEKILALGSTICASALGLIVAIRYLQRSKNRPPEQGAWWKAVAALLVVTAVSSLGMLAVVGLHHHITYMLQIDQFKGVKILAYMPIVLTGLYLIFFSEGLTLAGQLDKAKRILNSRISVLWVITVAVIGAVGMYYLSRTGNEGSASAIELMFRNFLENTLGVRPRTKEFLIAHPLLVFGAYLCFRRHMAGLYIMLLGAIGQASAIGTFTHLHSPLWISFLRVLLGVGFGALLGLVLIAAWQFAARGWNTWARPLRK